MTNDEKNQLVFAVISQLKSEGTDIANAEVIEDTSGVPFVIGYKANGSLVRVNAENIAKENTNIWNNGTNPSNMNDFVVAGVYNIQGERTRSNDNLPILNTGGGNTFNARLIVLDSSIDGMGKNDDKCITQVLSFSNRLGQGEVYIRTGKGNSLSNLTWDAWSTLQRNVNVVADTYDNFTDNGIYSGVANTTNEMFVLVVINNYALATPKGAQRSISQFKYSVNTGGSVALNKRVKVGENDWSAWEILNNEEIDANVAELVKRLQGTSKDSSPSKDPFKHLGVFTDINGSEFKSALNSLHTTNPQDNIMGLWRAEANSNVIEIQCVVISYVSDKWMQVLKSPFRYIKSADAFNIVDNPRYRTIYRFFENNAWGDWVDVEQDLENSLKTNADNITNEITRAKAEEAAIRKLISDLVGESPATLDTIHEISSWILNDKTGAAAMATKINANTNAINEEKDRAEAMEQQLQEWMDADKQESQAADAEIRANAMQYNTLGVNIYANKAEIYGRSIDGNPRTVDFPAATTEKAGVMSAEDKVALDTATSRALRVLFIAAGAEYNDTNVDKTKTAPWGETVNHKAGHYYLNGLGDITESEMVNIYNAPHYAVYPGAYAGGRSRTVFLEYGGQTQSSNPLGLRGWFAQNALIETIVATALKCQPSSDMLRTFSSCPLLRTIYLPKFIFSKITDARWAFESCRALVNVYLPKVSVALDFSDSPLLSKESVLYIIQNAAPTSTITITLHADAYSQMINNNEIKAALAAQPLVSLSLPA